MTPPKMAGKKKKIDSKGGGYPEPQPATVINQVRIPPGGIFLIRIEREVRTKTVGAPTETSLYWQSSTAGKDDLLLRNGKDLVKRP